MARLPEAIGMQRRLPQAIQGGARIQPASTEGFQRGAAALSRGLNELGVAVDASGKADRDYESEKQLLDFKLQVDQEYDAYKQTMPEGAPGFSDGWQQRYRKLASGFVGPKDANIAAERRNQTGLRLKQLEVNYGQSAHKDETTERDRYTQDDLEQRVGRVVNAVSVKPEHREEYMADVTRQIELSPLSPAVKRAYLEKARERLQTAYGVGRLQTSQTIDERRAIQRELFPEAKAAAGSPRAAQEEGLPRALALGGTPQAIDAATVKEDGMVSIPGLPIRAEISASAPYMGRERSVGRIREIITHGTADSPIENLVRYGQKVDPNRGFAPGYHFYVGKDGAVIQGAPLNRVTNGAMGRNGQQVHIAFIGADDGRMPTEQQATVGRALIASLGKSLKLDPRRVFGHGEIQTNRNRLEGGKIASEMRERGFDGVGLDGLPNKDEGYTGPFDALTPQQRLSLYNTVETDIRQQISQVSAGVGRLESLSLSGDILPEAEMADLRKRVDDIGDPGLAQRFAGAVGTAGSMRTLSRLRPTDMEQIVQSANAQRLNGGITPDGLERLKKVEALQAKMETEIKSDGLAWARKTQAPIMDGQPIHLKQLDFAAPDINKRLAERRAQAEAASNYYGRTIPPFTAVERDALAAVVEKGGAPMLGMVSMLHQGFGDMMPVAIGEIAPKAPMAARAAWLITSGGQPQAAQDIAETMQRRSDPNYKPLYSVKDGTAVMESIVGDAFRNNPREMDATMRAAEAIYEARATRAGVAPKTLDPTVWEASVKAAIGVRFDAQGKEYGGAVHTKDGYLSNSGGVVIVPPTVRADLFEQMLGAITPAHLMAAGIARPVDRNGKPVAISNIKSGTLVQVGVGQYQVMLANARGDEGKLMTGGAAPRGSARAAQDDNTGNQQEYFVLDLAKLVPVMRTTSPKFFWNGG